MDTPEPGDWAEFMLRGRVEAVDAFGNVGLRNGTSYVVIPNTACVCGATVLPEPEPDWYPPQYGDVAVGPVAGHGTATVHWDGTAWRLSDNTVVTTVPSALELNMRGGEQV